MGDLFTLNCAEGVSVRGSFTVSCACEECGLERQSVVGSSFTLNCAEGVSVRGSFTVHCEEFSLN